MPQAAEAQSMFDIAVMSALDGPLCDCRAHMTKS